jgi:prepilin-type N-terminal cleavage/methylation domain-containing protein
MRTKKAFTLIEVLIAITLAAILFTLIFRTYVSITQISTRMGNEKKLNAEITYLTETVQNIADNYQIDYTKYGTSLKASNGFT